MFKRDISRVETRRQRYFKKAQDALQSPIRLGVVSLQCDQNLAYMIRTAACFGLDGIDVIGHLPPRNKLYEDSGSTYDFVDIRVFPNTQEFLANNKDKNLISLELSEYSVPLETFKFNFDRPVTFVVGNETLGVPEPILIYSDYILHINMPGVGYCLNTAQAANIFAYESTKQYLARM